MHSLQRSLLDFNEFFAPDESDRLVPVLRTPNAEHLLRVLDGPTAAGSSFVGNGLRMAFLPTPSYSIPVRLATFPVRYPSSRTHPMGEPPHSPFPPLRARYAA